MTTTTRQRRDAWIDASAGEIRTRAPVGDITVEYCEADGSPAHTQRWRDGVLVTWGHGPAPDADVRVCRSAAVDLSDLEGGLATDAVTAASTLDLLGGTGRDIFGTTGVVPKETDGWSIASQLTTVLSIPDGPFGAARVQLTWQHNALAFDWLSDRPAELHMDVPYELALRWLWGDLVLGNLFEHGLRPEASNLFVLSELEGLVSAPPLQPPPPGLVDLLLRFRATRRASWPDVGPS